MKRIFVLFLAAVLMFSACAQTPNANQNPDKLQVVATIFPGYDFARAAGGEHIELTMLLPPGSESHSFEPTPQDIIKIQNCDVFIYAGGDSDEWVRTILDSMDTSNMQIISMMESVEAVTEEIKEGMEDDHGHSHGEFDPEKVYDRPLADFAGSWTSIETALKNGGLPEYVEHSANDNEVTEEAQAAALAGRWKSDYENITINENSAVFGTAETQYSYIGFKIVESDHGASVWYGFEAAEPAENAPKFIAFSDHGTGAEHDEHENEEEHSEHEEHDHEEVAHFHIRYGNESFEALTAIENWAPTYFPQETADETIDETMAGHNHEETEYDEHVWTSPMNAKKITQTIADAFCALDSANAQDYTANSAAYGAQLDELDAQFKEVVANAQHKTLIFADRFPFRYFIDEYGLDYYAAFPGCSTESDASAKTVAFLIDKINEEKIPVVFYIEFSNERMADTVVESTGAKKLLLHSCHNVTKSDMQNGVTYVSLMKQNVETLKEALS